MQLGRDVIFNILIDQSNEKDVTLKTTRENHCLSLSNKQKTLQGMSWPTIKKIERTKDLAINFTTAAINFQQ